MNDGITRRRTIAFTGGSLGIVLAGCVGNDDDEGDVAPDGDDDPQEEERPDGDDNDDMMGDADDEEESTNDEDEDDEIMNVDDEDEVDDHEEGDDDDEETDTLPSELPDDPEDDDFVDKTGEDEALIITRRGVDSEPDFVFDPPFVRVDGGTTLVWENQDGVFHTVTSTDSLTSRSGGGDDFEATISSEGDTFELETEEEEGRINYYCSPHAGFMFGAIEVE